MIHLCIGKQWGTMYAQLIYTINSLTESIELRMDWVGTDEARSWGMSSQGPCNGTPSLIVMGLLVDVLKERALWTGVLSVSKRAA